MKFEGRKLVVISILVLLATNILASSEEQVNIEPRTGSLEWIRSRLNTLMSGSSVHTLKQDLRVLKDYLLGSEIDGEEAAALQDEIDSLLASSESDDLSDLSSILNNASSSGSSSASFNPPEKQPSFGAGVCEAPLHSTVTVAETHLVESTLPITETAVTFTGNVTSTVTTTKLLPSMVIRNVSFVTITAAPQIQTTTQSLTKVVPFTIWKVATDTIWKTSVVSRSATQIDTTVFYKTITTDSPVLVTSTSMHYATTPTIIIVTTTYNKMLTKTKTVPYEIPVTITNTINYGKLQHFVTKTIFEKRMVTKTSTLYPVMTAIVPCKKGFFQSFKKTWFG